jgi:histidyl-tRNA synthetase
MKDFEADELAKIEHVRQNFLRQSDLFGFSFMEPSPLELLSVLETKSGPGIKDEIYNFTDKGDRDIALRFDFTVGITRYAVSQKSLKLPAKISSFGGVWRYDEPQKGRYRYFHQWDLEIYGKPSIESESEIIELTSRSFASLGLQNIVIDINHRNLVESFINKTFQSRDPKLVGDILRAVYKIQKKSRQEILDEFKEKGYETERLERILEFSAIKGTPDEIEKSFDVSGLDSWDELRQLWNSLHNRGVTNIRINFGIVRGLDYYSGTVFEVFDTKSKLGALAGGGRYDSLTKAFGRDDIGATGVAGGVERIILTMEEQGITSSAKPERVSVLYVNEEMQPHAMRIASSLRQAGVPTDIDLVGRPLKKQMDNASDSSYSVIVGPKELEEKNIVLRNMKDGKEQVIPIENLLDSISLKRL